MIITTATTHEWIIEIATSSWNTSTTSLPHTTNQLSFFCVCNGKNKKPLVKLEYHVTRTATYHKLKCEREVPASGTMLWNSFSCSPRCIQQKRTCAMDLCSKLFDIFSSWDNSSKPWKYKECTSRMHQICIALINASQLNKRAHLIGPVHLAHINVNNHVHIWHWEQENVNHIIPSRFVAHYVREYIVI